MGLRRRTYLVENWMKLKHLIPGVRDPLFHGGKVGDIVVRRQGIRIGKRSVKGKAQDSISFSRSLGKARWFGHGVVVVDRSKLNKAQLRPYADHPGEEFPDEMEERYYGNVPFSDIAAVIVRERDVGMRWDEKKSYRDALCDAGVPVVITNDAGTKFRLAGC